MKTRVLVVEDQFAEAHSLQIILERASYQVCGIARSMQEALPLIQSEKPVLVLLDIFLKGTGTGIDIARILRKQRIAFVYLSANFDAEILSLAKETQPYGFLIKPFRERDVLVTLEIAIFRHQFSLESNNNKLESIQKQLDERRSKGFQGTDPLIEFGKIIQPHIPFDLITLLRVGDNGHGNGMTIKGSYLRVGYNEYQKLGIDEWATITRLKLDEIGQLFNSMPDTSGATVYSGASFEVASKGSKMLAVLQRSLNMQSLCCIRIQFSNEPELQIYFVSRRVDSYDDNAHVDFLQSLQTALQIYFQNASSTQVKLESTRGSNTAESARQENVFQGIVGKSHLLLNIFDNIAQVAPFDTSVLVLGESGTGKERVATCIQELSPRNDKPFVKVNCAALPASLIESELFGHEKGSFTGAIETRKGHFEEASGGTIFLDEIGDIPLEVQVKLLRILQEKEFRRVGGRAPMHVDVRIITATNCNLEELVSQGRFRLDLYYRLNVFPIHLPPLRDRKEDISLLADHFLKKYNSITGKEIQGFSDRALQTLIDYDWPGNIRELENVIERSILLSSGNEIENLNLNVPVRGSTEKAQAFKSIEEVEREYILSVLRQCNGRIWGKEGAASLLNMPPTTLNSRIKKLGIKKEFMM